MGSSGTPMKLVLRGRTYEVHDGDVLLQRWAGWRAFGVALLNDGWSHAGLIVRGADGAPAVAECTTRAWTTIEDDQVRHGVGQRAIGRSFDEQETRCLRVGIARVTPPLRAAELVLMKAWIQKQLAVQAAAPDVSLYDLGADFVLSPLACGLSWSANRYTCSEFLTRAYAASGRWTEVAMAPLIPALLDGMNASVEVAFE